MNDLMWRWLDLPPNLTDQAWHVVLQRAWPAWVQALVFTACIAASWWSYQGLRGSRLWRGTFATVRMVILASLVLLLMQPAIEWPRERVEQDHLQVLLDRSRSMQVRDERDAQEQPCSRESRSNTLVTDPVWATMQAEHVIDWYAMEAGATPVADPRQLPPADGRHTLLAASLQEALRHANSHPVSAMVLVTDGRSQDVVDASVLRQLKAQSVPVFVVPLGDPEGLADRAIVDVEFPQRAFPKDRVPVQVTVSTNDTTPVRVVLRDQVTGAVLDERTEQAGTDHRVRVTLTADRETSGEAAWEVALMPQGQDSDASNDTRPVQVLFMDRPLRVLYVDGWPRWEYRYLKNILLREDGVESSVMLLSADRDFAQEGTAPLARLPATKEEFAPFDVIVIGDVPGGFLDAARQRVLRDHVAKRGAGLLWIGGERSTPMSWVGTPLEDLLPFRGSLDLTRWDEPVSMQPTPAAQRLGLMQLDGVDGDWPRSLGIPGEPWSRLEWAQRIDANQLKPTVETWATARPAPATTGTRSAATEAPLVVSMRFGAGGVVYVATDETWRWRHGQGETLPERFWVQIIRHLARNSLRSDTAGPSLDVEPTIAAVDQPVRVTLDGGTLADVDRVTVEARRADGGEVVELELKPDGSGRHATTWAAAREGNWTLHVSQPVVPGTNTATLEVRSEEPERLDSTPDHDSLRRLADATGGHVIKPSDVGSLVDLVPRRSITVRMPIDRPLWDRWPVYGVLAGLLLMEWIGRRLLRLA